MIPGAIVALLTALWTVSSAQPVPGSSAQPAPGSRVETHQLSSAVFGNTRTIRVYVPAAYEASPSRRFPVLVMNDGFAVFSPRSWSAPETLDRLIAAGEVAPFLLVGIDNAASIPGATTPGLDRAREYMPYADSTMPEAGTPRGLEYPRLVMDEVLPLVRRHYRVAPEPSGTAIGGSSLGAIAALVTVLRHPKVFGALLLESAPLFMFDGRLQREMERAPSWPDKVYLGLGGAETEDTALLARGRAAHDAFVAAIRGRFPSTRVKDLVVPGAAHNSAAWRARLPEALTFVSPADARAR
jgi:enterochelin esterase-like enzyme